MSTTTPTVVLVSMPWDTVRMPSIRLGILVKVLNDAGVPAEVRSFNLAFLEYLSKALPSFSLGDYFYIAEECMMSALGDWVFGPPPSLPALDAEAEQAYLSLARGQGVPERVLSGAQSARAHVDGFIEACAAELVATGARVFGFTSTFHQTVASLRLAARLKALQPACRVIFGGANCEGEMGAALLATFSCIDVVVSGEGEAVVTEVVRALDAGMLPSPNTSVLVRSSAAPSPAPSVAMEAVPAPDYDEFMAKLEHVPFRDELMPVLSLGFETARGCWWGAKHHCTFCGLNGSSLTFRSKSASRAFSELLGLSSRYKKHRFQAVDNILDLGYFDSFLPRLSRSEVDLTLAYEVKVNLKKDQVRMLREAGVRFLQPGVESLSQPILDLMRKGTTPLQNIRMLKWCAQFGIQPIWNIIYGFPREPGAELERTADVVRSLVHLEPPNLRLMLLDRFSPYHQSPEAFGLEITGPAAHYPYVFPGLEPRVLMGLAYQFQYRHLDGRDPELYVGALREVIELWQREGGPKRGQLLYRRGPGFLVIVDARPTVAPARYTFDEVEALIYLACDAGATPDEIRQALPQRIDVDADSIRTFLEELVDDRLVYEEKGRFLSLAVPEDSANDVARRLTKSA